MLPKRIRLLTSTITTASLLAGSLSWGAAECPPAVTLNVGDKVTDCRRVGVAKDVMDKIDQDLAASQVNAQIAGQQSKLIELKDLQLSDADKDRDLWKAEADRERQTYDKERSRTDWMLWGGILAGIALTIGAGWAVGQAHK